MYTFVNFKQSFLIADEGSFQETSAKIRRKKKILQLIIWKLQICELIF